MVERGFEAADRQTVPGRCSKSEDESELGGGKDQFWSGTPPCRRLEGITGREYE